MTKEKNFQYQRAYTELNEILGYLSDEQKDKIPHNLIENIKRKMDLNYKFIFDKSKGIFEQNLMTETKALLVEIYERYLANDAEKKTWEEYDKFCLSRIDKEKREKYDVNLFHYNEKVDIAKQTVNEKMIIKSENKKNLFQRILNYFKNFLKFEK